jgi:mannose-6-phosphate isomerase-like protein (cupin superfamily)
LHRAELWVVVRGTVKATIGEEREAVHENESIYIPIGTVHRLANQGKIQLELIECRPAAISARTISSGSRISINEINWPSRCVPCVQAI